MPPALDALLLAKTRPVPLNEQFYNLKVCPLFLEKAVFYENLEYFIERTAF